ncbi:MAG TPA: hypothetical protein DEA58_07090 [Pseudothermotoga sp.]|jgi:hypothetical protein|uniref:rod-binding protein n=1 Tax=Pseudothermotoga lettingae TaxID=177758 RepID=UPI000746C3B1|nr:rod-binding protein [Pseudothermotoga lettingae]KUK21701.1 MAG: Uncharacterized protein XD56_0388 [Pseudothermotoga lettingae]HBT26432.1 hypothetical protein [Pseudothermotoga sp.]
MLVQSVDSVRTDKLYNACSEFAGSLFYEVFKKMYDSIPKSDLIPRTPAQEWFTNMLFYEYSKQVAKDNLKSLVRTIYEQLAQNVYQ